MPGEDRLQRLLRRLVTARASAAIIGDCARLSGLPAAAHADGSQAGGGDRGDGCAHAPILRRSGPDPGLWPVAEPERPGNSGAWRQAGLLAGYCLEVLVNARARPGRAPFPAHGRRAGDRPGVTRRAGCVMCGM